MLAVVIAGGTLALSNRVRAAARSASLVIAADSGIRHLPLLGLNADVVLGDFDSSPAPTAHTAAVIQFPAAKDKTDTHLAIEEAMRRGADQVYLLAAMRGPRLDHAAANLALLAYRGFREIDLRIVDGKDEMRVVRGAATIDGMAGDLVSLISLSEETQGVTTAGLAYSLSDATLRRGDSRGVSNVMRAPSARVEVKKGLLLLVHRNGGDPNALA